MRGADWILPRNSLQGNFLDIALLESMEEEGFFKKLYGK